MNKMLFALLVSISISFNAFAEAPAAVTATCKDGTAFSGTTKKGACSGHKGVKEWGNITAIAPANATSTSAKADKATAAAATPAASTPAKTAISAPSASTKTKTSAMAQAPGGGPGLVWVNSSSKVYHCQGTAYYGKTKSGTYMSETDAKAKGNHADHGKACS